jgi:hypothetical protein
MPFRTISIPVAEIIEGGTKQEFYADLRKTLGLSVRMANIAATECLRQDDLSRDKCGKIYTYPSISNLAPGVTFAAASIARSVESLYRQNRFQVRIGNRSSQTFRSQPWPLVNNKSRKTLQLTCESEFLTARIKLLGGWWTVRLAGGSAYRDQVRGLRKAIESNSYGDSKIWVDRKHKAILGIACDISIAERKSLSGCMTVSSSRDHLLVATFERSDVPFVVNADVCKQWQSEANKRYQRLRQDRKSDANRRRIRREMNDISAKMNRRMKTLCHEVASRIVNKAIRMNVAEIKLDLTIKSYTKSFPWFDLAGKIKYKAESAGIKVVDATQTVSEPDVDKPHVYFKYAPIAGRIKIGMTGREDGGRHGAETDSPEELTILAIDNQPKTKLRAKEKHYHAMFHEHRVTGEWFHLEPILVWLREVEWLGNAGNLSQIAQVLDVSQDAILGGHLQANSECSSDLIAVGCSHNAVSGEDIVGSPTTALAVTKRSKGN